MSDNLTQKPPDNKKYLEALLKVLNAKSEITLFELLENSTCNIVNSSNFSRRRWDAYYTTVYFHVPNDKFTGLDKESEQRLIRYCDNVMPKNVGFDVMNIELSPRIDDELDDSLEDDLEYLSNTLEQTSEFSLPDDLRIKGKEMTEVYLYLYAIENFLRLFIEKVGIKNHGQEYSLVLSSIKASTTILQEEKRRRKRMVG